MERIGDVIDYQDLVSLGSPIYFSVRRLKEPERNAVLAIYAFYQEIEEITLTYAEPSIAHLKLNWWREEVINMKEGIPSHPLALATQAALKLIDFNFLRLLEVIDGLEQNITFPLFEKFEDVVVHVMRTVGVREKLIADVTHAEVSEEVIYQLSLVLELVHYLQYLHRYVKRDLYYFAKDELRQFQVTELDLHQYITTPAIRELFSYQAEKIERSYQKALEMLPKEKRKSLANLLIRCQMSLAVLKAIRSSDFSVLENFIDITPLKRWWIAWRFK